MVERIIRTCLTYRGLTLLVIAGACVAGVWAMLTLSVDAIPDLSDVQVIVVAEWDGQNPQVIEDQVTQPLSAAFLNVAGVRDVRAQSYFGIAFVYVVFDDGTDIYWAQSRVQERMQGLRLPSGPQVKLAPEATGLGWVYMYTLEDTARRYDLGEVRALHDVSVSQVLRKVDGVAEIAVVGGAERQYEVVADPERMMALRISVPDLADAIRRANSDVGGQAIEMAERDYVVRGRGYITSTKDIEEVVVRAGGTTAHVHVRDVAQVMIAPGPERGVADRNGTGEVVAGIVVMRQGASARDVIRGVKKAIDERVRPSLPKGIVLREAYDRMPLIKRSVATLTEATLQAFLMVLLVCFVFLLHARSAFVAFITLPAGALIAFLLMKAIGLQANIMSIAGITIAFGAMVDASICMVENAHRHLARGVDRMGAVFQACREVGPGLFASLLVATLTNLPLFALDEQAGRLFKPLAWTNTLAEGAACLLSITLIPPLIYLIVRGRIRSESENPVVRALVRVYQPVVRWTLRNRWPVVTIAAFVSIAAVLPALQLGTEFMPPLEEGDVLYMPTSVPGLGIGEARRALQTQDAILASFPEVRNVLGKAGRSSSATDSAPLEMIETTAQLYDEESWPERAVAKDWVGRRAREVCKALDIDASIAPAVESMTLADLNARIRRRLGAVLAREKDSMKTGAVFLPDDEPRWEAVRYSLQSKILRAMGPFVVANANELIERDVIAMLTARGKLPMRERSAMSAKLREWLAAHPPGAPPMHRVTFETLTREEMQQAITQPGMPNWFLMPIQTRIGMITTGMRTYLGLKVYGTDYERVEKLAIDIEKVLKDEVEGTVSAVAERVATGGYYLDVVIDRIACARYGLSVDEVQAVIDTAIGGAIVTRTIEKRHRFPVTVRYPRERRDNPDQLRRILVRVSEGARHAGEPEATAASMATEGPDMPDMVTLGQLASFELTRGPMMIKSDNGMLVVYLPVDFEGSVGRYVGRAKAAIDGAVARKKLDIPPGYSLKWSGTYEIMEKTNRRLALVIGATLLIIVVVLFLHFRRMGPTLLILAGTLLFAPAGAVWLTAVLGYDISTAWWLGLILLLGLAAETGVIMLVYIDNAYDDLAKRHGRMTRTLLDQAITEGAVLRVRPKVMTVLVDVLGMAPMIWAAGAGAATLQRMAAPLVGGMFTSLVLTLVVIPAAYRIMRGRGLPEEDEAATAPTA